MIITGLVLTVLGLHFLILNLVIFTAWPEMLSYPYLLSHGFQIYTQAVIPYPPLLPWLLEVVLKSFNFTPQSLRIFSWLIIFGTDLGVFYLLKTVTQNRFLSLGLLIIYILFQSLFDGNMLWFDNFLVLPLTISLILAWKWLDSLKSSYLFGLGLSIAAATAIKQTAWLYLLPVLFMLILKRRLENWPILALGLIFIWLPILIYLLIHHNFISFWEWNFEYPFRYWSKIPGYVEMNLSKDQILILGGLGLSLIIGRQTIKSFNLESKQKLRLISLFLIIAMISIYPRFSYFHFQPALAVYFMLMAYLLKSSKRLYLPIIIMFFPMIILARLQLPFIVAPGQIRFFSLEDQHLTSELKASILPNQSVYLLGLNSLEYVNLRVLPPPPWIDNFPWYLEVPGIQHELLALLKQNPPSVIFWRPELSYQPEQVTSFIKNFYQQSAKLDSGVQVWIKKS